MGGREQHTGASEAHQRPAQIDEQEAEQTDHTDMVESLKTRD